MCVHTHTQLNHCAAYLKLTWYCKSTILQSNISCCYYIFTLISATSAKTRSPSLKRISHLSAGSSFFLFGLPCRAPPYHFTLCQQPHPPLLGLQVTHWFPSPRPAQYWSHTPWNLLCSIHLTSTGQAYKSFLHVLCVLILLTLHGTYIPGGHRFAKSQHEETCSSSLSHTELLVS